MDDIRRVAAWAGGSLAWERLEAKVFHTAACLLLVAGKVNFSSLQFAVPGGRAPQTLLVDV